MDRVWFCLYFVRAIRAIRPNGDPCFLFVDENKGSVKAEGLNCCEEVVEQTLHLVSKFHLTQIPPTSLSSENLDLQYLLKVYVTRTSANSLFLIQTHVSRQEMSKSKA